MSSREERGDLELERLFKSMDEVRASDELKASTLAVIFEQLDEESVREPNGNLDEQPAGEAGLEESPADGNEKTAVRPTLSLVDGGAADVADGEKAGESDAPALVAVPTGTDDEAPAGVGDATADGAEAGDATADGADADDEQKAARPRRRRFGLKIAAALLVVAVGVGGVLSYAIPASHVTVSAGDTTFDLGVNVYGTTVSATANSDAGKAAISSAAVRNVGFEDALGRLIDAYDQQRGGEQDEVQVSVHDPFGGGERFSNEANHVLEGRRPTSSEPAEAPGPVEGGVPEGAGEPGGAVGPESEGFSAPAQDGGGPNGGGPNGGAGPGEGGGTVAEGELGGGTEPSGGGFAGGGGGQEPSGGPMQGGNGMEGSLGGANGQLGMSGQGFAPQPGQGQGQSLGGMPR